MVEAYGTSYGAWLMHGLVQVLVLSVGAWLVHDLVQVVVHFLVHS